MEAEADLASPLHFHPRGGGAHLLSETDLPEGVMTPPEKERCILHKIPPRSAARRKACGVREVAGRPTLLPVIASWLDVHVGLFGGLHE